jgi:uncharacterized protein
MRTAAFFGVTYLISWTAWLILFEKGLSHLTGAGLCLYSVAVFAPHVSAAINTGVEGGLPAVRVFYRRVFRPISLRMCLIAACVPPAVYLTSDLVIIALHMPHSSFFHRPPRSLAMLLFGQAIVVLGEEPGWRGFALPRLIVRAGPYIGTLILGVLWAVWHLPLFVVAGTPQYRTPFAPFVALLTAWSMIMTAMVQNKGGGTLGAMVFHAAANLCDFTMWEPDNQALALTPWVAAAIIAGFAVRTRE